MRTTIILFCVALLGACTQTKQRDAVSNNATQNAATKIAPAPAAVPAKDVGNVGLPDDRRPLEEPGGPIDPKSAEAAGQVAQHYGALIEQHRNAQAAKLWGDSATAEQFALQLKRYPEVHLAVGKPGDMEGAAGSSYVTVPVAFYGKDQNGRDFRRSAEMILRRVNDVPGSTQAQRRWHIERIDWAAKS